MVEEDGAGVDGRADGAEGDVPAHLPAHLVHRVDVERHRVLCADREFITLCVFKSESNRHFTTKIEVG